MSFEDNVEKEPAKWELISGNEKDSADMRELDSAQHGEESRPLEEDNIVFPPESGMILRRGEKAVGYIMHDVDDFEGKHVLFISGLFVLPEARNPGIVIKLVQTLRAFAVSKGVTHVSWVAGSPIMTKISNRVHSDSPHYIHVPIEKFDVSMLVGRI